MIKRMKDNLPMYLMHTMRQMRTAEAFYPMLDVHEVYKLVTQKEFGLEEINPELLNLAGGEEDEVNTISCII